MDFSTVSILFVMIFLDYVTGIIVAVYEKKINSTIGRKGIFTKFGIMVCVVLCSVIDAVRLEGLAPLVPLVTLFFTFNEGFSILENLGRLNVPIPKFLTETLKEKQKKNEK